MALTDKERLAFLGLGTAATVAGLYLIFANQDETDQDDEEENKTEDPKEKIEPIVKKAEKKVTDNSWFKKAKAFTTSDIAKEIATTLIRAIR